MTGIEILNSFEVPIEYAFNWVVALVSFIIIAIFMVILVIITDGEWWVGLIIGFLAGVMLGIMLGCAAQVPSKYETHYDVLISEEVLLMDFLEEYEIVGQEGKIYTIRERTE